MVDRQIEEATLNGWPALRQTLWDGWVLRFANGYTKRANSATPLYADLTDAAALPAAVDLCEAHYRRQSRPPIFRLLPLPGVEALDALLADRGYTVVEPTLVLVRDLADLSLPPLADDITFDEIAAWLPHVCAVDGSVLIRHETHRAILAATVPPQALVSLWAGGRVVACGRAVAEGPLVGLTDIQTAPDARRQGYAGHLVAALLAWGREQGATRAYLQVVRANGPARRLYDRFGFAEAHHYWYRVPG